MEKNPSDSHVYRMKLKGEIRPLRGRTAYKIKQFYKHLTSNEVMQTPIEIDILNATFIYL